jgi:two-component system phosphate regulon response regulator PhoB
MGKKIMVIEDDTDIRETIVYALQEENYEVIASEDARILKHLNHH